ncbi:tatD [Mytilus coruscus]|uniref:TatD n=1 Tax=Mytilus coruscus TaxID=42192 RepID=A0A6J8DU07_MYTCO|nr:tatD [Mytilus coruscus]
MRHRLLKGEVDYSLGIGQTEEENIHDLSQLFEEDNDRESDLFVQETEDGINKDHAGSTGLESFQQLQDLESFLNNTEEIQEIGVDQHGTGLEIRYSSDVDSDDRHIVTNLDGVNLILNNDSTDNLDDTFLYAIDNYGEQGDVWIEQEEDIHQEREQEEDIHQETEQEDVWIEQKEDIHQETEQEDVHQKTEEEDVRIVIREKERRRQEKEDERYHQVMREADEDLCVPMVMTKKQELEMDQKKYQEVLKAADEDMGIPIVTRIISKLTAEQQNWIPTFEEQKDRFGLPIGCFSTKLTGPLMAVDAHFHLDQLIVKTGLTGIHELDDMGECGLDTTDRPNSQNFQKQITYFEKQLNLAVQKNLPVVIHSRADNNLNLSTLTSMVNNLPKNHKIHWHCFTGTEQIFESASSHFSNIVFGVTPFIFTDKYPSIKQFICNKGINRIVLESDAPYIRYKEQLANPYTVIFVAHIISKLLLIPVEEILATTTKNSQMIYGC